MLPASVGQSGNKILKVHSVARRLGVSCRTVRWWAQTGQLSAFRIGVKLWCFHERDVEALRARRGAQYAALATACQAPRVGGSRV
jgi:excisionase family DNA binding protein